MTNKDLYQVTRQLPFYQDVMSMVEIDGLVPGDYVFLLEKIPGLPYHVLTKFGAGYVYNRFILSSKQIF